MTRPGATSTDALLGAFSVLSYDYDGRDRITSDTISLAEPPVAVNHISFDASDAA